MRILMISDVYFPRVNGVSTSIATFRRDLERLGHQVHLIAPDYDEPTEDERNITRIPARRVPFDPEDRMMQAGAILACTTHLQAQGFGVLHIQTPFVAHSVGVKLSRRLNIPCVETYHTFFEEYLYHYTPFLPSSVLRGFARFFSCRQCNAVDALIAPSAPMRERLLRYGIETPIKIIPTGIEFTLFEKGDGAAFRTRHGIPPERSTLVYVGRVAFEKNIDFLLHVVKRLKDQVPKILLIIAGEGPAERRLRRLAGKLDIEGNLLFVGYLPRQGGLTDCYRAGDVFVFASRTETQGLVLLEAMSLAVPVVSTAVMGTKDILHDGEGVLVAEEDVGDFSAKVWRLLQDPELRRNLGERGRQYVRQWRTEGPTDQLAALYRAVVDKTFTKAALG